MKRKRKPDRPLTVRGTYSTPRWPHSDPGRVEISGPPAAVQALFADLKFAQDIKNQMRRAQDKALLEQAKRRLMGRGRN